MCVVNETSESAASAAGKRRALVRPFVLSAVVICVVTTALWLAMRYVRHMADRFLLEIFMGQAR
jgi:multisubunit Na+/H+ antiporter MnhC subunit